MLLRIETEVNHIDEKKYIEVRTWYVFYIIPIFKFSKCYEY